MSIDSPTECEWETMSWEEQNIWMDYIFNFSSTPQRPQASNISRGTSRNVTPAIATEKKWDKSPRFYASGSSSLSYLTPSRDATPPPVTPSATQTRYAHYIPINTPTPPRTPPSRRKLHIPGIHLTNGGRTVFPYLLDTAVPPPDLSAPAPVWVSAFLPPSPPPSPSPTVRRKSTSQRARPDRERSNSENWPPTPPIRVKLPLLLLKDV